MTLSTGDSHIEEPALFFQSTQRVDGHLTGKDAFFHSHDKHRGKLQSFGAVNGHQRHAVFVFIFFAVDVGKERHLLQIVIHVDCLPLVFLLTTFHKVLHSIQESLYILSTRLSFRCGITHEFCIDAALFDNVAPQSKRILGICTADERTNQLAEGLNLIQGSTFQDESMAERVHNSVPEAGTGACGCFGNTLQGSVANAACRIVNNTAESLFVVGIGNHTHICYDILDFLSLEKAQPFVDAVGHSLFAETLLKTTALRVGAVKHSKIAVLTLFRFHNPQNVVTHQLCLLLVTIRRLQLQLLTLAVLAIHIFLDLPLVVLNQAVGSLYDELRGTVVAFQFEQQG